MSTYGGVVKAGKKKKRKKMALFKDLMELRLSFPYFCARKKSLCTRRASFFTTATRCTSEPKKSVVNGKVGGKERKKERIVNAPFRM